MAIDKLKKKKGTVYRARIVLENGDRRTKCFGRRADAEKWEAEIRLMGNVPEAVSNQRRHDAAELIGIFLEQKKVSASYQAYEKYEGVIRHYIRPYWQSFVLDEISRRHVEEFRLHVQRLELSASTKHFVFVTFKMVIRMAFEQEYMQRNPAALVKPLPKGKGRVEYWKEEEVSQFLSSLEKEKNPRLPVYVFALNTGLRSGEIFGLKWDCVDMENKVLYVRRSFCQKQRKIQERVKTNSSIRTIGISPVLFNWLVRLKLGNKSETVIDHSNFGKWEPSHFARSLQQDCISAGVRVIRFHDLRHTFATHFALKGGNFRLLSGMLGHSTSAMTDRYSHFTDEHAKLASAVVAFDVPKTANVVSIGHKVVTKRTAES